MKEQNPQIRDKIILILSSQRYSYLLMPEGKASLKLRIVEGVKPLVKDCVVTDVYFTEFAMQ
jgi:flagellar basal body-associated protein FliL